MPSDLQARVLCLEDDFHMRAALGHALAGYELDLVMTVTEAKERIVRCAYVAWLLDVGVSDGSGLDVLAWARLRGDLTPALVMTGLQERELANSAQILGAEFLYKPYRKAHIDAFLARATSGIEPLPLPVRNADTFAQQNQLTPREGDVVRAIARGVPRAHLAAELGVAESTVKTLVRRILARTGHDNLDAILCELLQRR
jgi:DNA-binding NarL/FixJ family response regulator